MTANEPRGRPPPTDLDPFERLGDGLWVVAPPHSGVELGEELATPPHGGAWLHLGQSGRVVVFTGKVDVGQGTRQAFARIVAGELGVAETRVLIVMGDTDRCPWDAGTFGSLATPTIAPLVRAVARRAAKLWWELAPGGSTACSIDAVGEALRGVRRTERLDDAAPSRTSSPPPSSRRPPDERRAEASRGGLDPVAVAMVTGARTYGSDLRRPGMLFGKLLRPPAHGATRRSLDTSVAESLSGVTVVVEGTLRASPRL